MKNIQKYIDTLIDEGYTGLTLRIRCDLLNDDIGFTALITDGHEAKEYCGGVLLCFNGEYSMSAHGGTITEAIEKLDRLIGDTCFPADVIVAFPVSAR